MNPEASSGSSATVVVCGAGIAGVSVAYHLTARLGVKGVVLVDPRPPLSLTSDKSTECYRNWWPSEPMVRLMNRSIDLLESLADATGNAFGLNRRGYLFVTSRTEQVTEWEREGRRIESFGAGGVRVHREPGKLVPPPDSGFRGVPDGVDLLVGSEVVRRYFPWVTERSVGALWVRRAGWLSAQQLGMTMLDRARDAGLRIRKTEVVGVDLEAGKVSGVRLADGSRMVCGGFVNASGPMLKRVGRMLGVDLPVHSEVHHKVAFRDTEQVVPRDAPMTILADPQSLDWDAEERLHLQEAGRSDLLGELPRFCHGRPEGGADSQWVVALWEYRRRVVDPPAFPLPDDPLYAEVVLRGMTRLVPAMARYRHRLPRVVVDGGYYTKTPENRPLIGPVGPSGSFVCGALSGFGVMAAAAAGELCALWVTGGDLPPYAPAFHPERYDDPAYLAALAEASDGGQL